MNAKGSQTDVDKLVATLRGAIGTDKHLALTGDLIACPALDPLLKTYFDKGTVDIASAKVDPSADGDSAVAVGTVTYGTAACAARLTLTPTQATTNLLLTLTPPAPWKLPAVFAGVVDPACAGIIFAAGGLVLCSMRYKEPDQGLTLQPGMSVVSMLDIGASYPGLALLLGSTPVAMHGAVSDGALPLMQLVTASMPAQLGDIKLADVTLGYDFCNITQSGQAPIGACTAILQGTLDLGGGITGKITAQLPAAGSTVALAVSFSNATLDNFASLAPFLGAADPLSCLPAELQAAIHKAGAAFQLNTLFFVGDVSAGKVLSAGLQVKIDLGGFQPFGVLPSLKIDDILIDWSIAPETGAMSFGTTAELEITKDCPVSVGIQTQPGLDYQILVRQGAGAKLSVSDLAAAFLPGLPLPELDVEDFSLSLDPANKLYALSATIDGSWGVLQDLDIALAEVSIDALYNGALSPALSGAVTGTLTFDFGSGTAQPPGGDDQVGMDPPPPQFDLVMSARRPAASDSWQLLGQLGDGQVVAIGDMLAALAHKFGVPAAVPPALQGLTISSMSLSLDTSPPHFAFACGLGLQVEGETVDLMLGVDVSKAGTGYDIAFGGALLVAGLEFDLKVDTRTGPQAGRTVLLAEYQAKGAAGRIDIKQLVQAVLPGVAAGLPDGLVIDLDDAMIAFVSENGQRKFVFAMDIALEFPLSDLPLIGKAVPPGAKAGLKNLKLVVASAALSADDVTLINSAAPKPVLPAPAANLAGDAVPKGFSMVAEIELGELTMLLTNPAPQRAAPSLAVAPAGSTAPAVTWVNVQKTFGPVSVQKVGFSYDKGQLAVLSNLSLAAGGLEIDLIGIGMTSAIKDPSLQFTIQGLAVSFQQGPVAISGGLVGKLDPVDFTGALSVRVPQFSLAALAGYAQYQDSPSFFLYGVLNAPLGGPPAFFVNGVAAGVGFNRSLVMPDVSGVLAFPLVAWAQGVNAPPMDPTKPIRDQVQAALTMLAQSGVVAPRVGDFWLAAGVAFTSFELVESFALLTISAGPDVEIDLLGLSTLVVPPATSEPVAEVQLELEVSFAYSRGLVAVAGQLTDNSYVLSRDCKLTGGFAFYLWFMGERAGETVLTLGGYNPIFTVPAEYPKVPRLGMCWQVVPELSVVGGLYFAVTPNVVMAGGKLSAVWNSGPISAWFTYWADFLMTFKPFHYYVDGGIDLGASFTVDLWLFSVSMTIHVGVELVLHGPPFAGSATVDLSIISFTIDFGSHERHTDTGIAWDKFVQELLPSGQAAPSLAATRRGRLLQAAPESAPESAPAAGKPAVVQINVTGGLVRALAPDDNGPVYLVNAETFKCNVQVTIPVKSVSFETDPDRPRLVNLGWAPDSEQPCDKSGHPIRVNNSFGVGPAQIAPDKFQPALTLKLATQQDSVLHAVRTLTNAPKALWENKQYDSNGVPQVDPGSALTQASYANALAGLLLTPYLDRQEVLRPVPLQSLLFTFDDDIQPFAWSTARPPTSDSFSGETVAGTICTGKVERVRGALLGALAAQGVAVDTSLHLACLGNAGTSYLESAPRLRLLGEQAAIQ